MNDGSPPSQLSMRVLIVPYTSASHPEAIPSELSIPIAPHAAQPYSVKNSGQQRTENP